MAQRSHEIKLLGPGIELKREPAACGVNRKLHARSHHVFGFGFCEDALGPLGNHHADEIFVLQGRPAQVSRTPDFRVRGFLFQRAVDHPRRTQGADKPLPPFHHSEVGAQHDRHGLVQAFDANGRIDQVRVMGEGEFLFHQQAFFLVSIGKGQVARGIDVIERFKITADFKQAVVEQGVHLRIFNLHGHRTGKMSFRVHKLDGLGIVVALGQILFQFPALNLRAPVRKRGPVQRSLHFFNQFPLP